MSNEYIVAKKDGQQSNGIIGLSLSVFESIAAFCIEDIEGCELALSNRLKKSVTCSVSNNKIVITINVAVKMGFNVNYISAKIQKSIIEGVTQITDFTDVTINVNVVSFYI